jgi:hypothetical protein
MNNIRSPAPAGSLFNMGGLNVPRNNGFVEDVADTVNAATNTAFNAVKNVANTAFNVAGNATNGMLNIAGNATNMASNKAGNIASKFASGSQMILIVGIFIILAIIAIFWKQIGEGFKILYDKIRQAFGAEPTPVPSTDAEIVDKPQAPQDDQVHEKRMVEKILPGRQQVFNISKNAYTYYDAEPLCKALGSELATYEQVKEAYAGGADWCNYGWVKGQMAVYPTQTNTWEDLQQGPEEQRNACGRPGVNGGFFDNPELRFGVSCYGVKPSQKDHDATAVATGDAAPLSPGGLDFEKKVARYRGDANSIGILPFSKSAWSA